MNNHVLNFIEENNTRIFDLFVFQPRYVPDKPKNTVSKENISQDVLKLLMVIYPNQLKRKMSLTVICKKAGFSAGAGSRNAKSCEEMGAIKIIQPKGLGRGNPRYPILTEKGMKILGLNKSNKPYSKGGGNEHLLIQHFIAEIFNE